MTSFTVTENIIYTNYVLVITDVGEECDDESALFYLAQMAVAKPDLFVEVVCVGGKMDASTRLERCESVVGLKETTNFRMRPLEKLPKVMPVVATRRFVLQIGPVINEVKVEDPVVRLGSYNYVLLGGLGTTNSSDGAAREFAEGMIKHAFSSLVIATKVDGVTRIPLFTAQTAGNFNTSICSEIMRVGFKNTLGRAPPSLTFLNQLVGPGGANYETAKSITDGILGVGSFDALPVTRSAWKAAREYSSSYTEEQVGGMARMLSAFHRLFGVPVDQVWSSSSPEFNQKVLECGVLTDMFRDFILRMREGWWIGMTPAYDLVAAWVVIMMCYSAEMVHHYFDNLGGNLYGLKVDKCGSELINKIMVPEVQVRMFDRWLGDGVGSSS